MSTQDRIKRPNGAEWDTVKFACPNCGATRHFAFHMIDDEQHFVMKCHNMIATYMICTWQSERYTHLPSDVEAPEWPFEPVVDDTQTVEVLVPIDDDGKIIAEVADFRGKDCDVVLPEVANSLGNITEER
tara:strand:+ start:125539 stop:125928 length:390 start_codon:yes stop_codon:yes gene_type:complete